MNFYNSIFFKNLVSIYVRAKYDYYLSEAILNYKSEFKGLKKVNEKHNTIGSKIAELENLSKKSAEVIELLSEVNKVRPLLNDFAHSANIFLTPLIDVTVEEIIDIYNIAKKSNLTFFIN